MDRSLTALAFFIAVALTVALVWPAITDWDEERARLETTMAEVLGGPVTLAGDVSVRLLPTPRLTATQVSLSDGEGRLAVTGSDLRAEIALWPLFVGRTVVNRFVLAGGEIHLSANATRLRELGDDMAGRLSLGSGRFRYLAEPETLTLGSGENAIVLRQPRFELWSDGSDALIRFAMRALDDEAFRADVTFRPQAEGPWRVDWRASYLEDALIFRGVAELDRFYSGASFVGEFTLLADDIHRVLGTTDDNGELALAVRGPFRAAGSQWFIDPTEVTLGTLQAQVEGEVQTRDGLALTGRVNSTLADLDVLGVEIMDLRDLIQNAVLGGADLSLPSWLSANLNIEADGVMLNHRVVRDLTADIRLGDSTLRLGSFAALLPGGTDARFYPRRDRAGGLVLNAASLRSLLSWLEYDVSTIGAEYLQALVLEASISEGAGPLQIEVSKLEVDGGQAQGTYARDENGALNISGVFSDLDLDIYSPAAASGSFIDRVLALANIIGTNEGAGFDLTGQNVTLAGASLEQFHIAATTSEGILEIEQASMDFTNGGQLTAAGRWSQDAGGMDLVLSGQAVDPVLFESLPLAPTAPADLDITLENIDGDLHLEGTVRSAGLEIDLSGNSVAQDSRGAITGQMTARALQPGALALALGLDEFDDAGADDHLQVQWIGPLDDGEVTAELHLAGLDVLIEGRAAEIFSPSPQAVLAIEIAMPSTGTLLRQLGGPQEADLDAMPFVTSGRLIGGDGVWRYQSQSGHVDDVAIALDVSRALDGRVAGSIRLARLALRNNGSTNGATSALAWSTEQFDLEWLEGIQASLNIAIDEFDLGSVVFSDVGFNLALTDNAVQIDQARGALGEGILTGSGTIAREGPALSVVVDMAGEDLPSDAVFGLAGLPELTGGLTLAAHLEGRGRSPFDLVASFDGRMDLDIGEGAFETIDMGHLEEVIPSVRTRIALRDAASQSVQRGSTPVVRLAGLVPISRGVLDLNGLEGIASTGAFNIGGSVDLRSQIVDVEAIFLMRDKDISDLPVTIAFRGVRGELSTTIDVTEMQAGIEDRLADTHLELLSEDDLPEDLQELLQAYEEAYPEAEAANP